MKQLIINKNDLRHNINIIKKLANLDTPNDNGQKYKIIGVVKGNGYGLGAIEYSKFLIDNGIEMLAIATLEEGLLLREAGIKENILMLSGTSDEEEIKGLIQNDIILTLGSVESVKIADNLAMELNKNVRAHIKIDTGFGRYGFIYSDIKTIVETIKNIKNIKIEGMYSHFSIAYYKKNKWTIEQFNRFMSLVETLKLNDINIDMLHICNSPGFLNYPSMHLNAARIGSAFLGRVNCENPVGLKKIGQIETNITEIKTVPKGYTIGYLNSYKTKKETKMAIVQFGYMEGYNVGKRQDMFRLVDRLRDISDAIKSLFKKQTLTVIIHNKRYNIIGKSGMYHLAIDITGSDIKTNDIVRIDVNPLYVNSKVRREYI